METEPSSAVFWLGICGKFGKTSCQRSILGRPQASGDILGHFEAVEKLIQQGKTRALQSATAYSILTYWEVGAYLSSQLTEKSYGKKIVVQFADWLHKNQPTLKGFDRRSLYRMRQFFESWQAVDWSLLPIFSSEKQFFIGESFEMTEQKIVGSATPQLPAIPNALTRITWTHHEEILRGATTPEKMLFYLLLTIKDRYKVRELVAFDLKIDEFKPEYMGKMNFYLELLDRDVRKPHENPSIGVVLCKSKNDEIVEITMSRQLTPALVAVYETKFIDKELLRRLMHKWAEDWEEGRENPE